MKILNTSNCVGGAKKSEWKCWQWLYKEVEAKESLLISLFAISVFCVSCESAKRLEGSSQVFRLILSRVTIKLIMEQDLHCTSPELSLHNQSKAWIQWLMDSSYCSTFTWTGICSYKTESLISSMLLTYKWPYCSLDHIKGLFLADFSFSSFPSHSEWVNIALELEDSWHF